MPRIQASFNAIQVCIFFTLIVVGLLFTIRSHQTSTVSFIGSNRMTTDLDTTLTKLSRTREKLWRYNSHVNFMTSCLQQKVIPK